MDKLEGADGGPHTGVSFRSDQSPPLPSPPHSLFRPSPLTRDHTEAFPLFSHRDRAPKLTRFPYPTLLTSLGLAPVAVSMETQTTIVAVSFDGGVVLGADSRVSTGTYVSNRASNKITGLCDNVFLCRSGSAAHTEAISDYVRFYASQHACEIEGREPTVKSVASILTQMSYNNKGLMAAMIVAGYDKKKGGQVFGSPIGGTLVEMPWAIEGSGSTYIWSFFDDEYRPGMTREETEKLVLNGIAHAMARDGSSGGIVRLVTVDKDGGKRQVFQGKEIPMILGDMAEPAASPTVVW